jgi:lysophospholipase L1-like esterase
MINTFFRLRIGRVLGMFLFLGGVLTYHSPEHPDVLGRWSYPYSGVIALALLLGCAALTNTIVKYFGRGDQNVPISSTCPDLAVLLWGGSYFLSSLDDSINGGRIADLNVVGATMPVSVLLEWLALLLITIAVAAILWTKREKSWVNVGLVLWSVVLLLVLSEGFVRVVRCIHPVVQGFPTYSSALWSRRHVQLNQAGFRDAQHTASSIGSRHRLLVVGDSYAFGWGISRVENRFGEQLAMKLSEMTGTEWEAINVSRPDTHTRDHIKFLESALSYRPDVVILLYVFNDIDYLYPVTVRGGQSESPRSFVERVHPIHIAYRNSYFFQELYVRARLLAYRPQNEKGVGYDPYADSAAMERHLGDISLFVSRAATAGAVVRVVPFDISAIADENVRLRYGKFVRQSREASIQILPVDHAFLGYAYNELTVNTLDRHPNELANRLVAETVAGQLARILGASGFPVGRAKE